MSSEQRVAVFTPYPFRPGEKIRITAGPRRGDWEVFEVSDRKVGLRCPISGREFTWDRFCYLLEEKNIEE
ncbi:MAG: hypothetical protein AB1568_14210 [Thermodesulfobacteriota bacterium]